MVSERQSTFNLVDQNFKLIAKTKYTVQFVRGHWHISRNYSELNWYRICWIQSVLPFNINYKYGFWYKTLRCTCRLLIVNLYDNINYTLRLALAMTWVYVIMLKSRIMHHKTNIAKKTYFLSIWKRYCIISYCHQCKLLRSFCIHTNWGRRRWERKMSLLKSQIYLL